MLVEISKGELIDKLTILELKMDYIKDESRLVNVRKEYEILKILDFETPHRNELKQVNSILWYVFFFGSGFLTLV